MLGEFIDFVEKKKLVRTDSTVLLAVSGGIDSMVMATLFIKAGFKTAIAHCNFMLRGEDSDGDEHFVRTFSEKNEIPFYTRKFETEDYAATHRISIQMAAREMRYSWFEDVRSRHGCDHVATAHHRDDVVETFIINLTRGTGISGLHGIPVVTGNIIRPLLFAWRSEIEAYARAEGINFREDVTNRSVHYTRNKIRLEIIPSLEEINPAFREQVVSTAENIREAEELYRKLLEEKRKILVRKTNDEARISIEKIRSMDPDRTLIFEIFSEFGVHGDMAGNILSTIGGIPGKKFETPSHQILIDREDIIVRKLGEKPAEEKTGYRVDKGIKVMAEPLRMQFIEMDPSEVEISGDRDKAFLDRDKIRFPLTIRRWKRGDAFMPLGMNGMKKLSDFFIDEKFSRFEKENTWLLCSGEDIVWVIGHRIDERYKVERGTKHILVVKAG